MSGQKSEPVKFKVTEPQMAEDKKDYRFLLEENLELLRKVEALSKAALQYNTKLAELTKQVADRDLKMAKSKTFAKLRKFVAAFHILLGLGIGAFGPVLWLTNKASPEACWGILGGAIWLIVTTAYIDAMAVEERNYS